MKILILLAFLYTMNMQAGNFSATNIQYLNGQNFHQLIENDSVSNGKMETISIEHFSTFDYGSNFFFVDFTSADFDSGDKYHVYGEWSPKFSFSKIMDSDFSSQFIKDIYVAGELNQGNNFRSINLGLGLGMNIPGFDFLDLNLYSRKDTFNDRTMQVTLVWKNRFAIANIPLVFEGFSDYYGVNNGTVLIAQPRLLLEGKGLSESMKTLELGLELYLYQASVSGNSSRIKEAVPQFIIKWIL